MMGASIIMILNSSSVIFRANIVKIMIYDYKFSKLLLIFEE